MWHKREDKKWSQQQYTHAAIWVVIAEVLLGFGDKALDLYKTITPVEHARTIEAANKYKVEPYVIPADVYGSGNLSGRGGWTWYTGSAGWFYRVGTEELLGLHKLGSSMKITPKLPISWDKCEITYRYIDTEYHISIIKDNIELYIPFEGLVDIDQEKKRLEERERTLSDFPTDERKPEIRDYNDDDMNV